MGLVNFCERKKKVYDERIIKKFLYFCPTNEDFMRLLHILGLLTLSAQIYAVPARFHVFRAQMSDGTFSEYPFFAVTNIEVIM